MITGKIWELHNQATLEQMDAAAIHLLSHSGCRIDHDGLLNLMESAGCQVTRNNHRCRIPERLIRKALECIRKGNPDTAVKLPSGWNPQHHLVHSGSYPHILDWPSGERRLATHQDLIDMARMAHVMDDFKSIGRLFCCHGIDPRIEPLWTTVELAKITTKPIGGGEIFYAEYIEPLVRMAEVLTGNPNDTSLVAACDFFIAPLIFDQTQAECFMEKRRVGCPNCPGTMPISGLSGPVTIAGTALIGLAELLAGWVFGYVVNPDLPVGGIVASGSLDMRSATPCFGSPEALLQDAMVVQTCRRLYSITVYSATGYVDCKRPGIDAVFQKMLPMVAGPLQIGAWVGSEGLLSAGQDYSPVQHMLDSEITKGVERFRASFDVTPATLAVDLIEEMMARPTVNFADTDHTLEHFRNEQWFPRWLDRTLWQGQEKELQAEQNMLRRIDQHCKEAIASYQRPDIDRTRIAELERILLHAARRPVP